MQILIRCLLIAFLIMVGWPARSHASRIKQATNNTECAGEKAKPCALAVLRQLLADISQFEETFLKPVNIVYLKYRIADLLWEQDPALARRLFIESFQETSGSKLGSSADKSLRLRREVLEHLLPHDPALAEELALTHILQDNAPQMQMLSQQATLLVQVATHLMATSSQRSALLLQRGFNGWFSPVQIEALQLLREHSPTRADEIFKQALSIVERKPSNLSNKVGILSPYLFPDLERGGRRQHQTKPVDTKSPDSNTALIKSYLEFVYKEFMRQAVETQLVENNQFGLAAFDKRAMQELVPYFEKYLPNQAAAFQKRIEEVSLSIKQTNRRDPYELEGEYYRQLLSQSVPDLLKKVEQTEDQKQRVDLLNQAILIFMSQRKFDEAIALLPRLVEINNDKSAGGMAVYWFAAEDALEKGNLEQAAKYLEHVKEPDSRTRSFLKLMRRALAQQKLPQAQKYLDSAKQAQKQINDAQLQVFFQAQLATAEATLTPANGWQAVEAAIEAINRIGWGNGNGAGMGPDGITLRMNSYDFSEGLHVLARTDFSRALALTRKMQNKEASAFAQLAICRAVLGRKK